MTSLVWEVRGCNDYECYVDQAESDDVADFFSVYINLYGSGPLMWDSDHSTRQEAEEVGYKIEQACKACKECGSARVFPCSKFIICNDCGHFIERCTL